MNRSKTWKLSILFILSLSLAHGGIFVDQVGYRPSHPKFVFINQLADSFWVIDKSSSLVQFSGKFGLWKTQDPASGMTIYRGDFSGLTRAGLYTVKTSGGEESPSFVIQDTAYVRLWKMSLKGFYFQRCGTYLPPPFAGVYNRPICHLSDGTFHSTAESTGVMLATGGWHDAGDYGKYVVNAGVSVGTLLMAYEMFPDRFSADNVGIPESGNKVPDILDETRYELEWLLRMQASNGGVFTKLTTKQFDGFEMPDQDIVTRFIYQISSAATGDFVAMMARAARVYQPFDAQFAQRCLAAASKGWQFLEGTPSIVPAGGFKNPSDTFTGEYGDGDDRDERLWAAAEMAAATKESKYLTYYGIHYFEKGYLDGAMSWPNLTSMAHLTYLLTSFQGKDSTVMNLLRSSLQKFCEKYVTRRNNSGFRVSLVPGEFSWGCNSGALNNAILLIAGYELFGTTAYRDVALDQLHYILGVNPYSMSYITGVGTTRPMNPHHRPSGSDGIPEPVPGLLVGGPDQYRDDAILAGRFTATTPPALCYADVQASYASNEICINWNAPLVFVSGYFAYASTSTGVLQQEHSHPSTIQLGQNYPNPFNPSTAIRFQLSGLSFVTLKVFDPLGREVATLVNSELDPGAYERTFDGTALPSGAYFYQLRARPLSPGEGTERMETKKLILLR
jgi:endoglucanase